MLVLFGLFLAYESCNVHYYFINDSHYFTIATFVVVIVVGIGAPLSLVLSQNLFIDPSYGLAVFTITSSVVAGLLIVYVPKFVFMAKGKSTMVSEKMGSEVVAASRLQLGTIGPPMPKVDGVPKEGEKPSAHQNGQLKPNENGLKNEDSFYDSGYSANHIDGTMVNGNPLEHIDENSNPLEPIDESSNPLESIDETSNSLESIDEDLSTTSASRNGENQLMSSTCNNMH